MQYVNTKIIFLSEKNGGRSRPISTRDFHCPVYFKGVPALSNHAYDCRLLVSEYGKSISPGDTVDNLKMIFLSPDEVLPNLNKGIQFTLWEGKTIAKGEILSVYSDKNKKRF